MKDLIKGDFFRIIRKPSFWIIFLLMSIVSIAIFIYSLKDGYNDDYAFFVNSATTIGIGSFIFCLNTVIAVYSDEFKSSAYISVIGHGLSRFKLIIAKFLDCMLLLGLQYIINSAAVLIIGAFMGHTLKGEYLSIYLFTLITSGSTSLISAAFATIFAFLTMRVPTIMAAFVIMSCMDSIVPVIINLMPVRIFFGRYYYNVLNQAALSDFMFGSYAESILVTAATFCIYVGIPLFLAALVFGKKELEL
ncbi:MAG: hypothetical protein IJL89_06370 [Firmicutes bacterium]|nr:hypothetical protein [Bacillota bacterium]